MKLILENIRLIATVATSIIGVIALGWYAYAHLHETYVEEEKYAIQCTAWKAELDILKADITGVRNDYMLYKYQTRMWQLEQWLRDLEMGFGNNCDRCSQRDKAMYWEMRKEHQWLKQQIQQITGYGG